VLLLAKFFSKGEILYPIYFLKQAEVEIEPPFYTCGEISGVRWWKRNLDIL